MKHLLLTILVTISIATSCHAQGARSICINEVMLHNEHGIQDEYAMLIPWVELVNKSYSTYNVRDMFITTDKTVLDKKMSVPERIRRMSKISAHARHTILGAHEHLLLFLNSNPHKGAAHLNARIDTTGIVWIALYDANAVDLIDSVSVPTTMPADASYARRTDGSEEWIIQQNDAATPGISNAIEQTESKVDKIKRDDPHGFGITIMCMGIVFLCLALLYCFFVAFGWIADRRSRIAQTRPVKPVVTTAKKIEKVRRATTNILQDGFETRGRDKEIYIAVIAMALKQYADNVHDNESGIISIKPHNTDWNIHNQFLTNH